MAHCQVHLIKLPGCPHPNPADTYAAKRAEPTGGNLLGIAAANPDIDHDTLTVLADAADPKE